MTTLIKLGGSLITDKRRAKSFRRDIVRDIADQLRQLRLRQPDMRLIIGHGSGSFGHHEAQKHHTIGGVRTDEERLGFARVGAVATELSQLILRELLGADLPAIRFQPSSMLVSRTGRIHEMETEPLVMALEQKLLPLIHGDIAVDREIGGTIVSTEAIFAKLVRSIPVDRIVLLGEVDGVLDEKGDLVPSVTPATMPQIQSALGAARGVDVTGGMLQKVSEMIALVAAHPALTVHIANGNRQNILIDLLINRCPIGTRISAE